MAPQARIQGTVITSGKGTFQSQEHGYSAERGTDGECGCVVNIAMTRLVSETRSAWSVCVVVVALSYGAVRGNAGGN